MLWDKFLAKLPVGSHPWNDITPHVAIQRVRLILQKLGVPNANEYGTHDFRRGHAEAGTSCPCLHCILDTILPVQDMRRSGCPLAKILAAGQWKSSAFLRYLDAENLETDSAYEVAIESEAEEWLD